MYPKIFLFFEEKISSSAAKMLSKIHLPLMKVDSELSMRESITSSRLIIWTGFVNNQVNKTNRSKISQTFRGVEFGDEGNTGPVYTFQIDRPRVKIRAQLKNVPINDVPEFLEKQNGKTIRARSIVSPKFKNNKFNFFPQKRGFQRREVE